MSTNFPWALDSLTNPTWTSNQSVLSHSDQHTNANDAIEALEAKVGIDWSADTNSLDYKTSRLTAKGDILTHDWTNPIRQPAWTNGHMLVVDNTSATWLNYIAPTSWGTVTSSAFTNWNGVNWVVSNPTTTPTLALSFPNSWLQKSNGTALSSATAWTDYSVPTGVETLTNKTLTSPTITTPIINIGSDANGDTYYRNAGTTKRLGIGSENLFMTSDWAIPQWNNPFAYEWTLNIPTATSNWAWVVASTHYQTTELTVGTVALTRWTSWYAKVRYSPDNATWTDIYSISTAGSNTFPLLMRKGYWYYVEVDSPVGWTASQATLTALF